MPPPEAECALCGCTQSNACLDRDGLPCSWHEHTPELLRQAAEVGFTPPAVCTFCVEAADREECRVLVSRKDFLAFRLKHFGYLPPAAFHEEPCLPE